MSHNCPPPPLPVTVYACGVEARLWISISLGCIVVFIWGGWFRWGVRSSNWLCVSIKYSAWPMGSLLEASLCVLRGHDTLTAARGANPALHSSHIALPPLVILATRTQAVQSITASPSFSFHCPPPSDSSSGQPFPAFHLSTLCLMLASSFFVSPLTPPCA